MLPQQYNFKNPTNECIIHKIVDKTFEEIDSFSKLRKQENRTSHAQKEKVEIFCKYVKMTDINIL